MPFLSKVYAKYKVEKSNYGFVREVLEEDVVDALQEVSDEDWVVSKTSDYKSGAGDISLDDFGLRLMSIGFEDPENLQDIPAFINEERGFLKNVDSSKWAAEMKAAADRDYTHIVKQKLEGKMHPAITINGEFGDGRGRTLLQYALDEPVLVAKYKTDLGILRNN